MNTWPHPSLVYEVMALVSAAVYAAVMAVAAPKDAALHQRGPYRAAMMNPAMAAMSTTEATSQAWSVGRALPPEGAAARKNPPRPATMTTAPSHSCQPSR